MDGKLIRCSLIFWETFLVKLELQNYLRKIDCCEGLITIEECVKALDTFEKGNNPDFFLPLVIKGNEFVHFNKGKHTSFTSRV